MIDVDTAVVYFFVAVALVGFCLPSMGMVVAAEDRVVVDVSSSAVDTGRAGRWSMIT